MRKGPVMRTAEQIVEFSCKELAKQAATYVESANRTIRKMKSERLLHICRWERNDVGVLYPVYRIGDGEDAEKPIAFCKDKNYHSKRGIRYRKNLAEKYGKDVAVKMYTSRNNGGADRVVIDGKTVYQRGARAWCRTWHPSLLPPNAGVTGAELAKRPR